MDGYGTVGTGIQVIGEEIRDAVTVVTIKYHTDKNRTVVSKVIEFHLAETSLDWRLVDAVVTFDSVLPMYDYSEIYENNFSIEMLLPKSSE